MKKAILSPEEAKKISEKLYQEYGKPLEGSHWGEFLAVSQDGKIVLGRDLLKVTQKAVSLFGPGNFLFKVGDIAVGKWR